MNKLTSRLCLIIILTIVIIFACGCGGDGNGTGNQNFNSGHTIILSPDATATYGADQLYIQLTAIANPDD